MADINPLDIVIPILLLLTTSSPESVAASSRPSAPSLARPGWFALAAWPVPLAVASVGTQ